MRRKTAHLFLVDAHCQGRQALVHGRQHHMAEQFSGGCAWGAIRFVCSAEPLAAFTCHCRDCQPASGAPLITALGVSSAAVTVTGEPKYYAVQGRERQHDEPGLLPKLQVAPVCEDLTLPRRDRDSSDRPIVISRRRTSGSPAPSSGAT